MDVKQRRSWWKRFLADHPEYQQFGQPHSYTTIYGGTGCTHTVLQCIYHGWKGKSISQDGVSALSGYSREYAETKGGMVASQMSRFFYKAGLPYKVVFNLKPVDVLRIANQYGPVMIGMTYDWHPEKRGARYRGVRADGRPNGYALRNGKTQLTGFSGGHAELLVGWKEIFDKNGKVLRKVAYLKDPNHGSFVRPERPAYDVVTLEQFANVYNSWHRSHHYWYAAIPTEKFNGR